MIGKTVALIQVPNQRAFRSGAAAQYLGVDEDTLHKYDPHLKPRTLNGRRVYLLENLDSFLEALPEFESGRDPRDNGGRSQPEPATSTHERTTRHAG